METRVPAVVWLAVVAGFAARLTFALGYWVDKPLTHDEHEYLLLAGNLAAGRGFAHLNPDGSPVPGEHFGRAPIYPLMLAGVIRAVGAPPGGANAIVDAPARGAESGEPPASAPAPRVLRGVRVAQAGLGGVVVWLIARLAHRAAGSRAAVAAGWLAAAYPPLVWTPAYIWSETLFSVLALACAAALTRESRSTGAVIAAGVLAGLAVLTRPAMLFFVPLAAAWLCCQRRWRPAAVFALACAVVVAPWTLRNAREVDGRFVLVASEGGVTFWTGNHPLATGEGDLAANPELKRANVALRAQHPGMTPEALEPIYYQEAMRFIREQPGAWMRLLARKAFYTVVPMGPSYRLHSALYFGASAASYLAVLPFALLGLVGLARRGRMPAPLLLLAAASLLVCLVFFPQERFRIPVVDPALLVSAASWWALRA